jgi:hypothetical protein
MNMRLWSRKEVGLHLHVIYATCLHLAKKQQVLEGGSRGKERPSRFVSAPTCYRLDSCSAHLSDGYLRIRGNLEGVRSDTQWCRPWLSSLAVEISRCITKPNGDSWGTLACVPTVQPPCGQGTRKHQHGSCPKRRSQAVPGPMSRATAMKHGQMLWSFICKCLNTYKAACLSVPDTPTYYHYASDGCQLWGHLLPAVMTRRASQKRHTEAVHFD